MFQSCVKITVSGQLRQSPRIVVLEKIKESC